MTGIEMVFLIMAFLLGGLFGFEAQPLSVKGVVGGHVTITCSHNYASSNIKYFCKSPCTDEDVLISSKEGHTFSRGRYNIQDQGNTFHVTITELKKTDTGIYWCGIDRRGFDTYKTVHLMVDARKTNRPSPVKDSTTTDVMAADGITQSSSPEAMIPNASPSDKLVYIGAGLGVAVLTLAISLLIFIRQRNRDTSASSGKDHDIVYATPSNRQQDVDCDITNENQETESRINTICTSSTIQHQDTSRDYSNNIYSHVAMSLEPQIQPDNLFYSTLSFNKDSNCSSLAPHSASVTYASIENISRDSNDESSF